MKKTIKLLFSSFALLSLISCVNTPSSLSSENSGDTSIIPISITSIKESSSSESSISSSSESNSENSSTSSSSSNVETYFTVTFLNYDDSFLQAVRVLEGEEAQYSGTTPTKPEDDEFRYEFIGWDQDLKSITSDVTTRATYNPVVKIHWGPIEWGD